MSESKVPDPDAEREVDLRSAWTRITARWYLPVAGLVIGAILGVLASASGGEVFRARTLLYLGQPFTTSGGGQIQSLATNPKTVSQIIRYESTLRTASRDSGLTLGQLRGHVTSAAVVSAGQGKNVTPLVEITVDASAGHKAEKAANSLANTVIGSVSTVRRPEDRAPQQADRLEQGRARGHQPAGFERRRAAAGGDQ